MTRSVYLDDVLHLMRCGERLETAARRLGVTVESTTRAVNRADTARREYVAQSLAALDALPPFETVDGLSAGDVSELRRLVLADRIRTRADVNQQQQHDRRSWRWSA